MCSVAFSDQNARIGPLPMVGGAGCLVWCQRRPSLGVRTQAGAVSNPSFLYETLRKLRSSVSIWWHVGQILTYNPVIWSTLPGNEMLTASSLYKYPVLWRAHLGLVSAFISIRNEMRKRDGCWFFSRSLCQKGCPQEIQSIYSKKKYIYNEYGTGSSKCFPIIYR